MSEMANTAKDPRVALFKKHLDSRVVVAEKGEGRSSLHSAPSIPPRPSHRPPRNSPTRRRRGAPPLKANLRVPLWTCAGTLRYVGQTKQSKGQYKCGVELDDPVGKHDGSVNGEDLVSP